MHNESSLLNPVRENKASYDLVAPCAESVTPLHSLERQADLMFSSEHMLVILSNPRYLFKFREFLYRTSSLIATSELLSGCSQGVKRNSIF